MSDMGLARVLSTHSASQSSQSSCGTVGWRAPEVLFPREREKKEKSGGEKDENKEEDSNEKEDSREGEKGKKRKGRGYQADMWSVGCIAYFVLSGGSHPYGGFYFLSLNNFLFLMYHSPYLHNSPFRTIRKRGQHPKRNH